MVWVLSVSFQSSVLCHLVTAGTRPQLTKKLAARGARYNTVYTKDAPFNISQGFLIIMDSIKNDVK